MARRYWKAISLGVAAAMLAGLAWYGFSHRADFASAWRLDARYLTGLAALAAVGLYINGLALRLALRPFGVALGASEALGLSAVGTLTNFIFPLRGGTGVRAAYLKARHGFSMAAFAGTQLAMTAIAFAVLAAVGLASSLWVFGGAERANGGVIGGFAVLLAGATLALWIESAPGLGALRRRFGILESMADGWTRLRRDRQLLAILVGLTLANLLLSNLLFYLEFRAIGFGVRYAHCLFYACVGSLAFFVSLTPSSLGIREGMLVLAGHVLGAGSAEMLVVSLIDRVVPLCVSGALSAWYGRSLWVRAEKP